MIKSLITWIFFSHYAYFFDFTKLFEVILQLDFLSCSRKAPNKYFAINELDKEMSW